MADLTKKLGLAALGLGVVLIGACETEAQRKAKERAAVDKKAAAEINRICALPDDQREAELTNIKEQSGVVLFCGSK